MRALIEKGQGFSEEDQRFVMSKQHEILKGVLPAYREAAARGSVGAVAQSVLSSDPSADLRHRRGARIGSWTAAAARSASAVRKTPRSRFAARWSLHERTFGVRPVGMWPSEGSVSNEAVSIAAQHRACSGWRRMKACWDAALPTR